MRRQQWAAAARARKMMKPDPDAPEAQRSSSMLMVEGPDGELREYGESPGPGEEGVDRQYVCKICNARFVLKVNPPFFKLSSKVESK